MISHNNCTCIEAEWTCCSATMSNWASLVATTSSAFSSNFSWDSSWVLFKRQNEFLAHLFVGVHPDLRWSAVFSRLQPVPYSLPEMSSYWIPDRFNISLSLMKVKACCLIWKQNKPNSFSSKKMQINRYEYMYMHCLMYKLAYMLHTIWWYMI